jgi:hypothetical protein
MRPFDAPAVEDFRCARKVPDPRDTRGDQHHEGKSYLFPGSHRHSGWQKVFLGLTGSLGQALSGVDNEKHGVARTPI